MAEGLQVIWVIYGSTPEKRFQMLQWSRALGAAAEVVVNNDRRSLQPDEIAGSNQAYEFSGYAEGLASLSRELNGPVLVVNDTLLANHWAKGWGFFFRKLSKRNSRLAEGAIYSDWRPAVRDIEELKQPFYASWVFWCVDDRAVIGLKRQLHELLNHELPPMTAPYARYIEQWLSGKSRWRGWHQQTGKDRIHRKQFCIRMEHRLSALLSEQEQVLSFGNVFPSIYSLLRMVDRLRTLMKRWGAFDKSVVFLNKSGNEQ